MVHIALFGLPIGTTLAVLVMMLMPVLAYLLYRIDIQRGDGRVTAFGKR